MKRIILVAGATGNLGGRIIDSLLKSDADVRAVVRTGSEAGKIANLERKGVNVHATDLLDKQALKPAMDGVFCVVSALQGLRNVIVDTQQVLLDAAVEAGVTKFIPSDYSTNYNDLPVGGNRNFDLRREFKKQLDQAGIHATSVFNGAFADILTYNTPTFDTKKKMVGYWGDDPDWKLDFTTMDDTAAFTAAVALDPDTPRDLQIAGFQVSPNELVEISKELTGEAYALIPMGNLDEFGEQVKQQRATNPEGENELYPRWQSAQYMHGMFSTHHNSLDNERYPGIQWTGAKQFITSFLERPRS